MADIPLTDHTHPLAPDLIREAHRTLARLLPRLTARYAPTKKRTPAGWDDFTRRLHTHFPRLFALYYHLYHGQYDFFFHLEALLNTLADAWLARSAELQALDTAREQHPAWFLSHEMVGAVCYVDLFADNLAGIQAKIPYFKELGITYLHLMPLFRAPEGENDGGYAVSSYREVHPPLGTMEQLETLACAFRSEGISLVIDLVFNHTSDEHEWALAARAGDPEAQSIYRIYPDRIIPDQYERTLREIFPDEHPGAFSPLTQWGLKDGWVWTTFHRYQWDLNYANPDVFNRMAGEMLYLANIGVEVIRLDAVAFIWKQMGTSCENLPEAHTLIQAFNAVARIAAPALLFKSEAIVHPDDVNRYIAPEECQLSYNPLLMALLWESLATRKADLLRLSMSERFQINPACAWVNYVRVHDDIGWTFADEDAERLWINGYNHRRFLNDFYMGRFEGSFARGLPFQYNPKTGDARISGTCASLAGLEKALAEETEVEVSLALGRILLIHSIILSMGGIPLLYLGDEIGTLNDYSYRDDPAKAEDSRWVHRPRASWDVYEKRHELATVQGRLFQALSHLIHLRKTNPALAGNETKIIDVGNPHIFAYVRQHKGEQSGVAEQILIFASFSENLQTIAANEFRLQGLTATFTDLVSGKALEPDQDLDLGPFQFVWLKPSA
ncbi:MAG: alpha-glucosidase C-terminal domain-containing protein [Anaerolineales bacterium]|nr:alpha-glucosidase C-terminal domain-containing protein [Anaerolineales bacterium]